MSARARVLLAAGGTGGHLFPAEALAAALQERGFAVDLVTDRRGGGFAARLAGIGQHRLAAGGIAGKGLGSRLGNLLRLAAGYVAARRLLRRLAPSLAVGFGGYASLPPLLAAQHRGIPSLVHEQNAVAGRANRLLARRAAAVATSFPRVRFFDSLPAERRILTGNPVRPEIAAVGERAYHAPSPGAPVNLLIFGGSQGARIFARLLPEAIAALAPESRARLSIVQQCRAEDAAAVAAAYARLGVPAELAGFFADMPARLERAHLVIARAGASTIAELAAAGRPALLVPLANAIDGHQLANATALGEAGAALVLEEAALSPALLARHLERLIAEPRSLAGLAEAARGFGRRDAAARLADLVERLAAGRA